MSDAEIPSSLRVFLERHVPSIWVLELLLFLREHADYEWDVLTLNRRLCGTVTSTQGYLDEFVAKKILTVNPSAPPRYRFNIDDSNLKETVDLLAQFCSRDRDKVIECIYSSSAKLITTFADAFIFKKEKKNG